MKLEIDCSWEGGQKSAKVLVHFGNTPKSLFNLTDQQIDRIRDLEDTCLLDGPVGLKELETICKDNPKSLYAGMAYFFALKSFEFFDEAKELFNKLQKDFPDQIMTKCVKGLYLMEEDKDKEFYGLFSGNEVIKGAFPDRDFFHYKEVLLFHFAWEIYHSNQKDVFQQEKHEKMSFMIKDIADQLIFGKKAKEPSINKK